jgi:hypothetical protein
VASAQDEGRHDADGDRWWGESWYFDFAAADGSLGGYVRLGFYPNQKVAWWWAYLVGEGRPLVALRAHEVPMPKKGLEVRDDGLWACLTAETPHDHWSVGMEAFGVAFDDPADAYRGERGDRVPFGLDLEWEASAPVFDYPGVTRYEQACTVYGDILVGDERLSFEGPGERDHSWGQRDWWRHEWCWTSGALDDGTRYHGCAVEVGPDARYLPGFVAGASGELEGFYGWDLETALGPEGLPRSARMQLGGLDLDVTPIEFAPILLTDPFEGRVSRFPRAMCRVQAADGRAGVSWTEWNQPQRETTLSARDQR